MRASHNGPVRSSRIEVSSRNSRASLGLAFENLLGQEVQDVAVAAREGLDEAGDVLSVPHGERGQLQARRSSLPSALPASRHPPLTGPGPSVLQEGRGFLSVKARSAAPSSVIWPLARSVASGRGGSMRLEMTRCTFAGRRSSKKETIPWTCFGVDQVVVVED